MTTLLYHSPIGDLLLGAADGLLTGCDLAPADADCQPLPEGHDADLLRRAAATLDEYFSTGRIDHSAVPLAAAPTPFAQSVRRALMSTEPGDTLSYSQLAQLAGHPAAASRAVARVMATNPLLIFVPCHRVIRADGGLGGFRAGIAAKRHLLALESRTKC